MDDSSDVDDLDDPDGGFGVVGVVTRTTNAAESNPATARLPELWARAFAEPYLVEQRDRGVQVVAVLTDYASDHTGAYTQVVGVRVPEATTPPEGLVVVAVPAEHRTRVPARGPMPGALVAAWGDVWRRSAAGELDRAYRTDYEVHTTEGADLYLSVAGS